MTHLYVGGYDRPGDPDPGVGLLLAHAEKNVRVDAGWVEDRNAAYFSAAKWRNRKRREALTRDDVIGKMAAAIECMNAGWSSFRELLGDNPEFDPAQYDIKALIDRDLRNDR
jgi:hypothetical protein